MSFKQGGLVALCVACAMLVAVQAQAQARDPFVSILDLRQLNARADLSGLSLKGVIWESARPVAIINDTLVSVGDDFSGFKMARIDKDKVTLTSGKESYELYVDAPPEQEKIEEEQGQASAAPGSLSLPESDLLSGGLPPDLAQDLPQNLLQELPKS
jgi:hypothetical protein